MLTPSHEPIVAPSMGQVRPIYRDAAMYWAHHNCFRPAPDFSPGPDSRDIHAHHALGHAPGMRQELGLFAVSPFEETSLVARHVLWRP